MRHRTQYHTVMILTLCLALSLNAWPAVGKRDNVTVNAGPGSINCVDADDWWTARFEPQNCYHALAVMTSRHVAQDPEMPYEFLARRTTGRTSFTQLQTPQWTSSETCTIALVMLHDVDPRDIQIPAGTQFSPSEITDFRSILRSVLSIANRCLSPASEHGKSPLTGPNFRSGLGWASIGLESKGLGVFIWDSQSVMQHKYLDNPFLVGSSAANMSSRVEVTS